MSVARRRLPLWPLVVAVAGAAVVATLLIVTLTRHDSAPPAAGPTTSTTATTQTTSPPATSSTSEVPPTTAAPEPPADRFSTALWPQDRGATYADGQTVARSFAKDFLGFTAPVVGTLREGDARSGEVDVRPRTPGPTTTVLVRELTVGRWFVIGASTSAIVVEAPGPDAAIAAPVALAGKALAFEGTVNVEVRDDTSTAALGTGVVTGGGDILRPFTGQVAFDRPHADRGSVVFLTRSAEDGSVSQATVVRVRFVDPARCGTYRRTTPAVPAGDMAVTVFFSCGAGAAPVQPATRVVPASPTVLRASLEALVRGPTEGERAAGLASWFSPATASSIRSVTLAGGHAVVDFADLRVTIPNASASAGSAMLLAELDSTVFQFRTVDSVEYRILGDCEAFSEWLQFGGCAPRTRITR